MGKTGDAAGGVNAIEEPVEGIVVAAIPHKLIGTQRNRVPDFRRARLFLAGRQNAAGALVSGPCRRRRIG